MSSVINYFTPLSCDFFPQSDSNPTVEIRTREEKNLRDDCLALEQLMQEDLEVGRLANGYERNARYFNPMFLLIARVTAINPEIVGPVMMKLVSLDKSIKEMYDRQQETLTRQAESYFFNLA